MTDEKFKEIMQWVSERWGEREKKVARLLRGFTGKQRAVFAKEIAIKFEVNEAEFDEKLQLYLMKPVRPWLKKSDVKKRK